MARRVRAKIGWRHADIATSSRLGHRPALAIGSGGSVAASGLLSVRLGAPGPGPRPVRSRGCPSAPWPPSGVQREKWIISSPVATKPAAPAGGGPRAAGGPDQSVGLSECGAAVGQAEVTVPDHTAGARITTTSAWCGLVVEPPRRPERDDRGPNRLRTIFNHLGTPTWLQVLRFAAAYPPIAGGADLSVTHPPVSIV